MKASLLLGLAFAGPSLAASPRTAEGDLRRHIAYLASDALQGRKPGSEGEQLSARYIAEQLAAIGAVPGAADGSWYQKVPLVERAYRAGSLRWRAGGGEIALPEDAFAAIGRNARAAIQDTPVVFVGHGLDVDGWRNLEGVSLKGAVALIVPGAPAGAAGLVQGIEARKRALLAEGAVAVLVLSRTKDPWPTVREQYTTGRSALASEAPAPIDGTIAPEAWQRLAAAAGESADTLAAAAETPEFRAKRLAATISLVVETAIRPYEGINVVGRLPGTRPDAGRVVHLAHHDHLGLCRPEGAPDRICNGAVDNASGVAMLIEVARGLAAAGPAPRDQIFLATTAEEMGLLGARHYVAALGEAKRQVVAALNYDTVAIVPAGLPVSIIGRGLTPALDKAVETAAKKAGRRIDKSDAPNAFVSRQDGWEFLKVGIPAVAAGGSFTDALALARFLAGPYHKPDDAAVDTLELGGATEDTGFAITLGKLLADPQRYRGTR